MYKELKKNQIYLIFIQSRITIFIHFYKIIYKKKTLLLLRCRVKIYVKTILNIQSKKKEKKLCCCAYIIKLPVSLVRYKIKV